MVKRFNQTRFNNPVIPDDLATKKYVDSQAHSPLTTKGDLFGFDTVNNRIPIGTNDFVLTADSTTALGLKWGANSAVGEDNTSSNSGSGEGLALAKVGVDLPFKSLIGELNKIVLAGNVSDITFTLGTDVPLLSAINSWLDDQKIASGKKLIIGTTTFFQDGDGIMSVQSETDTIGGIYRCMPKGVGGAGFGSALQFFSGDFIADAVNFGLINFIARAGSVSFQMNAGSIGTEPKHDWDIQTDQTTGLTIDGDDQSSTFNETIYIKERASALGDKSAHGQLWVKDTTPTELWFTDDAGTDTKIV